MTDAIGWIGTALVVLAYGANSWGYVKATDAYYQGANLLGALALGVNVTVQRAWPALALQVVWGLVAIVALIRSVSGSRRT